MKYIKYFETIEEYESWMKVEENAEEVYRSEEKIYGWLQRVDIDNSTYDINDKLLNKGNPRKRINVKVDLETHKKLRVVSAIQDRSLDKIVGTIIEYEAGETNDIDSVKLIDEILDSIEDNK